MGRSGQPAAFGTGIRQTPVLELLQVRGGTHPTGTAGLIMSLPRLSIRSILFAILLLAVDFAALRAMVAGSAFGLTFGILSILPMVDVLAVACYRRLTLTANKPVRPSFAGFGLMGSMAVLLWLNYWLMADGGQWMSMLKRFETQADRVILFYSRNKGVNIIFYLTMTVVFHLATGFLPQLTIALTGGWITRQYSNKATTICSS